MCTKVSYPTGAKARAAAARIRRHGLRSVEGRKPIRAYHCPHCHKFHLTGESQ